MLNDEIFTIHVVFVPIKIFSRIPAKGKQKIKHETAK